MDTLELVQTTGDAAFATDEEGRIVIWNRAAERLLGYPAARVLGKPCHTILRGTDSFGNRYCDENCNLAKMARRGEPIQRFELDVRASTGALRVGVSVLCVRGPKASQFTLIHLLQPAASAAVGGSAADAASRVAADESMSRTAEQPSLTGREVEVLRHLAGGLNTREIADTLFISVTTVRTHIQNILQKLDVHSQVQAVSVALRKRLI